MAPLRSPFTRLRPGLLLIVRGILVAAFLAGLESRAWMTVFIALGTRSP